MMNSCEHETNDNSVCDNCEERIVQGELNVSPASLEKKRKGGTWNILLVIVSCTLFIVVAALILVSWEDSFQGEQEQQAVIQSRRILMEEYGLNEDSVESVKVTCLDTNKYMATCHVNTDGELFFYYTGTIYFNIEENDGSWQASEWREFLDFSFFRNNNFYLEDDTIISINLLQFSALSEDSVTVNCYSYNTGNFEPYCDVLRYSVERGRDSDTGEVFFYFSRGINNHGDGKYRWCIYSDRVEYCIGGGRITNYEFKVEYPVDPENYWWYVRLTK